MRTAKYKIELSKEEEQALEQLVRKQTIAQNIAKRAKIILMANDKRYKNKEIAKALGIRPEDITKWTKRWIEKQIGSVEERLSDIARPGAVITAEQWCNLCLGGCITKKVLPLQLEIPN